MHIYVAVVTVSVGVCAYKLSTLPHFLAACTHSSDLLCDSVISSGREKMRPWRWLGTLKAAVLHLLVRKTFNK